MSPLALVQRQLQLHIRRAAIRRDHISDTGLFAFICFPLLQNERELCGMQELSLEPPVAQHLRVLELRRGCADSVDTHSFSKPREQCLHTYVQLCSLNHLCRMDNVLHRIVLSNTRSKRLVVVPVSKKQYAVLTFVLLQFLEVCAASVSRCHR